MLRPELRRCQLRPPLEPCAKMIRIVKSTAKANLFDIFSGSLKHFLRAAKFLTVENGCECLTCDTLEHFGKKSDTYAGFAGQCHHRAMDWQVIADEGLHLRHELLASDFRIVAHQQTLRITCLPPQV